MPITWHRLAEIADECTYHPPGSTRYVLDGKEFAKRLQAEGKKEDEEEAALEDELAGIAEER